MKIAFVVSGLNHISGISTSTSTIVNNLAKDNRFEITVISLVDRSVTEFVTLDSRVQIIKVYHNKVNLKRKIIDLILRLKKLLKNNEFEVIVLPLMFFLMFKIALGKHSKTKIISWDHASIPSMGRKLTINNIIRYLSVMGSDRVVTITKGSKRVYESTYKKIKNVRQIYNTSELKYDEMHVYNNKSKKILSAGSLNTIKGFDLAIEAAKKVFNKETDWEWHIYGDGNQRNNLQKLIKEYNLENNVILKGHSDKLEELYQEYSFFVLPSRSESFGMVILEAQINKLPVISFDSEYGPRELIQNDVNGFLIEKFDTNAMAKKINYLINNEATRIEMSNKSMILGNSMSNEEIIDQWKGMLKSVMSETKKE